MVDLPDPRTYELSAVQRAAAEFLFQGTLGKLAAGHQCAHCERVYRDWDALGTLPCRGHPGRFDFATGTWLCCGQRARGRDTIDGCVRADHTPRDSAVPVHMYTVHEHAAVPLAVFLGMPDRPERALAGLEHVPDSGYRAEYGGWDADDAEEEDEERAVPPVLRAFDPDAIRAQRGEERLLFMPPPPGARPDHRTPPLRGERALLARRQARTALEWAPGLNLSDVQVLLHRTAAAQPRRGTRAPQPTATLAGRAPPARRVAYLPCSDGLCG